MKDQINIFGKIENGKLIISNRDSISDWIKLQNEGDTIVLRYTNQKDYRSVRQIRLLYKQFREIAKFTGSTVEDIKLMLKYHFGLCYSTKIEGNEITVCKSISDLKKSEISELIEQIDIWSIQTLSLPILTQDDKNFLQDENNRTKITK